MTMLRALTLSPSMRPPADTSRSPSACTLPRMMPSTRRFPVARIFPVTSLPLLMKVIPMVWLSTFFASLTALALNTMFFVSLICSRDLIGFEVTGGVDRPSLVIKGVMQMRPAGAAGVAAQCDDLSPLHLVARLDLHLGKMAVDTAVAVTVVDAYAVAVLAFIARSLHPPRPGRQDRRSGVDDEVDAVVELVAAAEGIAPHPVGRADVLLSGHGNPHRARNLARQGPLQFGQHAVQVLVQLGAHQPRRIGVVEGDRDAAPGPVGMFDRKLRFGTIHHAVHARRQLLDPLAQAEQVLAHVLLLFRQLLVARFKQGDALGLALGAGYRLLAGEMRIGHVERADEPQQRDRPQSHARLLHVIEVDAESMRRLPRARHHDFQVVGMLAGAAAWLAEIFAKPAQHHSPSSSSWVDSTPISFWPLSRLMSVTPWVARLMARISLTRVRISTPPSVISMISSSSFTSVAATTLPLRSLVWIAIMPCVARAWRVYSAIEVRLP